ncbi:MAG: phosphatidate cytidylyltransferase [Prevotella sp.]|nr:phosphatidate cytidylyltransferase [Alistipes senegalensis]MCM1358880.1 phosphatidate cytidylyltransferase [Prevotella sp.]MCM1472749.1 phosphatidate cytidylyltransferase [Muribaculaceae bacterium]
MLTRIISGAVGVLLLAVVLYFHNTIVLPIAVAVIIAIMLYELLKAVKMNKCIPVLIASEVCGIVTPFISNAVKTCYNDYMGGVRLSPDSMPSEIFSVIQFSVTLLCAFVIFVTWLKKHKEIRYEQIFFVLAVMVLVPQAMSTMVRINNFDSDEGLFLLIMGLCGAWIADTGAYFSGVALGKHKLCPEISPKKTIEGFIGGILTTGIVYAVAFYIRSNSDVRFALIAFIIGVVCAVIGTVGDLSASMVKRQIGFKDYGNIMPGHGGLMDRFDSVLFVLPTFYAFIVIISVI